ncbi:MAG TPA: response regulator transcription factor [Chitinophagaceae bacterium]|nr:response regulator transcription factor [Chitinophagaceae bacterium]
MVTKTFIVDDHYMVIEGIRSLLQNEKSIEWMGHAMNASSCLAFLNKQLPDVILMDINLPDISGIDLCKEVKTKYPSVFIIGLSTFNQQSFIQKMMDNGASGYVLKNATQDEITSAIETVMKGKTYLSEEASNTLRKDNGAAIILTRREKEVLELIADGMTNAEIAQKLFISVTTVDTHRKNLLAKFETKNTAALIKIAVSRGYL